MSALPRFDNRAKNALAIAQQIAIQLGHHYIGSEHLLFGILSQPQDGLPFQMAFIDNVSNQELLEIIRKQGLEKFQVEQKASNSSGNPLLPEITEELQRCLDTAIKAAESYNYSYIGIEHLIFGILDTPVSHGQQIMNLTQSSLQKLKDILVSIFNSYSQGSQNDYLKATPGSLNSTASKDANNKSKSKGYKGKDSALDYFTTNLNERVEKDKGFNLVERDKEVDRLIQILSRKNKNNPIILGEPGVGKTALVEGLAKRINEQKVPDWLKEKKVLSLDIGNLVAGSVFRGEFEQRLKSIIEEVTQSKNVILFIDEIHTAIGAGGSGSTSSGPEMSGILKPALARGDFSIIGATTEDEYRTIIKKDKAFERRFQPVRLEEPDITQTIHILRGIKSMYEDFHQSVMPDEHLERLVNLSARFLPERKFPDKAIDILDEALVRCRILASQHSRKKEAEEKEWVNIEQKILTLIKQKNDAILNQDVDLSKKIAEDQKKLEEKLANLNVKNKAVKEESVVSKELLEKVVSEVSGVPLVRVSSNIFTQIKSLQEAINSQIFGQFEASEGIAKALKRSYAGVNPHRGPISSFLLLGPTGTGKTEMVKVITRELYGDPDKYLLKIDMSEFRERHQMSRLLGAPAGYVGYEDAPQLTEFLRKRPFSVILFDEIEKGHPENLNILLQMLEEGKITDAKGNTVSCEHALVFLTSNLGKNKLNKFASKMGFIDPTQEDEENYEALKKQVMEEVEKNIKPEILGRLTSKIVFRPITGVTLRQIFYKELGDLQQHLLKQGRSVTFKSKVVDYLMEKSNSKIEYGAREVKGIVAVNVSDPIAEFILDNPKAMNLEVDSDLKEIFIKEQKNLKIPSKEKVVVDL